MTNQEAKITLERLKFGVKYLNKLVPDDVADEVDIEALDIAIKALEDARPSGEWRTDFNPYFVFCNKCGSSNGNRQDKFCPNCGADMRGGGS